MSISPCRRTSALVFVLSLVLAATAISGCAYRRTPPLTKYDLTKGYRFNPPPHQGDRRLPKNSDELFVVLALSGGGTRAAALSYGVLHELDRVRFCWNEATGQAEACPPPGDPRRAAMESTLLDEVDVISSVSGGSFTAAYYALKGRELFDPTGPFHRAFLYHKVQRDLFAQAVYYPQNWKRLRSRVEIAANYYAAHVFGDATYRSLEGRRPYIVLNATDMSTGARLEFTQDHFDLLCANLSEFPIARAVAASSAFPGLLNSMTIDSHIVTYPTSRLVRMNGQPQGLTNQTLTVQAGHHRFDLGAPFDYQPSFQDVIVTGTFFPAPMPIQFMPVGVEVSAAATGAPAPQPPAPSRRRAARRPKPARKAKKAKKRTKPSRTRRAQRRTTRARRRGAKRR